jgi:hypothetical protein
LFDRYKQETRKKVVANPSGFALRSGLSMGVLGAVLFQNVIVGVVGGAAAWLFARYWWRPGGPGSRG